MKSEALECLNGVPAKKLAELRAKTNRELAEYVRGKLNLAVQLACEGERERRAGGGNQPNSSNANGKRQRRK
jgi:hypothetical protein